MINNDKNLHIFKGEEKCFILNEEETKNEFKKITNEEKIKIASEIKNISLEKINKEMDKLINIGIILKTCALNLEKDKDDILNKIIKPRSKIGNNIVDYFTFLQRLETKGKYNINYFEFLEDIDKYREKKFIKTMLKFYENKEKEKKNKKNKKNEYVLLKEVYNICISAINIMKPLNCMEIFIRYNSQNVVNFCSGWGGSAVACSALNLKSYYGIEINKDLEEPYKNLYNYLNTKSNTKLNIKFEDALETNIEELGEYDTIFTSPPYYFIEKYPNNKKYISKIDMDNNFYKPVFEKYYKGLNKGGYFIINICREVYEKVLIILLGEANETFPLKKSSRQNDYNEMVYVWKK
jgi:hypothetical protein